MIHHFLSRVMYTCFWSLKVHPRRKRGGPDLITTADSEAIIGVTAESTNCVLEGWHCNLLVRKFYLPPRALRHLQTDWGRGIRNTFMTKDFRKELQRFALQDSHPYPKKDDSSLKTN